MDRGALLRSRPLQGVPCKFRTCYDMTLWPLSVAEAEWTTPDRLKPPIKSSDAVAAVRIALRCVGEMTFGKLSLGSLRFYLSGESGLTHNAPFPRYYAKGGKRFPWSSDVTQTVIRNHFEEVLARRSPSRVPDSWRGITRAVSAVQVHRSTSNSAACTAPRGR